MSGVWNRIGSLPAVLTAAALSAVYTMAPAQTFDRGEALYENHCRECHESWAHTRDGSRIRTMEDLRNRVRAWSIHSGLGWSEEEVEDVSNYLDRRFYQLSGEP